MDPIDECLMYAVLSFVFFSGIDISLFRLKWHVAEQALAESARFHYRVGSAHDGQGG